MPKPPEALLGVLALGLAAAGGLGLLHTRSMAASSARPGGTAVAAQGYAFGPSALTVHVGDTVTWSQDDATIHTVTGKGTDAGKVIDSGDLAEGDTYEVTFTQAGTYAYYCRFHPGMVGTITVGG